ncbi:polynucleotide adenylyltransferase PcnB [Psychrobacter sp. 16-MNA-CIBAN-0192]|uniref:polynucleotide adenylyltransferase PcnB n=1 Tax=Psychrobacter sp. 16-MNA-CIBAN-0192 TaxID=3140448 RepID=UPI00331CD6D6
MAERAAKQLELNKSELPNSITEVIATLSRAGFDAYIVGGGVRDTLLGLKPKDFDAVTDAKPHEIKDVFGKRCRIIGRRFQLAHVYSGRELIEVATFRGPPINDANTNQDGMILRDNVWGDIKQDFARRDFSINALYYQPLKGVVHDFCGALDDIDNKIIRLLGEAPVRIEEDPVRLLRALRFKAKLGFEFDSALAAQFHAGNWALLEQISPHRLYDETQKMFTGGYLVPLLPLLFESGAIDSLIIYPPSEPNALVKQVAINTDKRINAGKSINPAFFYAALLWENYLHQLEKAKKRNMPFADAQMQAAGKVIDRQRIKTAIPKFAEQFIRDIWLLQPKLAAPRSKQIEQLSEHPRFRAGFDFLLLREQCGDAEHPLSESTNGMGDWWQTYQTLTEREQQQAIDDFDGNIRRGSYKRGRGRNRQPAAVSTTNQQAYEAQNQPSNTERVTNGRDNSNQKVSERPVNNPAQVNDASNIPARRRRAVQKSDVSESALQVSSTSAKAPSDSANHASHTEQMKQDSREWSQLQQLSLANNAGVAKQPARPQTPTPLFVIEHENVVPPLKRQLVQDDALQSESVPSRQSQNTAQQKPVTSQNVPKAKQDSHAQSHQVQTTTSLAAEKVQDKPVSTESSNNESSNTKLSHVKPHAVSKPIGKRTIAQAPQLVTIDNEPIPYKRRRRVSNSTADNTLSNNTEHSAPKKSQSTDSASIGTVSKASTPAKYEKKAPKVVHQPKHDVQTEIETTKVKVTEQAEQPTARAKPSKAPVRARKNKASPLANNKANAQDADNINGKAASQKAVSEQHAAQPDATNKGPVPAKRRRRQPSE